MSNFKLQSSWICYPLLFWNHTRYQNSLLKINNRTTCNLKIQNAQFVLQNNQCLWCRESRKCYPKWQKNKKKKKKWWRRTVASSLQRWSIDLDMSFAWIANGGVKEAWRRNVCRGRPLGPISTSRKGIRVQQTESQMNERTDDSGADRVQFIPGPVSLGIKSATVSSVSELSRTYKLHIQRTWLILLPSVCSNQTTHQKNPIIIIIITLKNQLSITSEINHLKINWNHKPDFSVIQQFKI